MPSKNNHGSHTILSRLNDLRIGTKFIGAISIILVILTFMDITHNANKEKRINDESMQNWTYLVAETVRASLNTLMRENHMDIRFALFETLSKELTRLNDIRVIRASRTNEIFLEVNKREIIPQLERNKALIQDDLASLNQQIEETSDPELIESLHEKLHFLEDDLQLIDNKITEAGILKAIDPREQPRDELDMQVIRNGTPIYRFEGDNARVLIPFVANRKSCAAEAGCHSYAKDGDVLGAINLEFSIKDINENIRQSKLNTAGFWGIRFLIFLIVISLLLTFLITRNLKGMLAVFNRMSDGDLSIRAPVTSNDEIGQLAAGFNRMADALDKSTVSKEYVDNIIRNMMDILVILSPDKKIVRLNVPTCELLGYTEDELIGQPMDIIFSLHQSNYEMLLETGKISNLEGTFFSKSNTIVPVIFSMSVMHDMAGNLNGIICVAKDITEQKESVEKLKRLTYYDGLTGLLNRTRLIEILNKRLSRAQDLEQKGALLIVDIDDFMSVNDRYGQKLGDAFIKHIATLVRNSIREHLGQNSAYNDMPLTIARLGADEFAIILPDATANEALKLAETIRDNIVNHSSPLFSDSAKETASIGIALYPEHAETASELLTRADTAMYRAKEMGGNQTHIFSHEKGDHTVFHTRRTWKDKIHAALKEDRFETWYQPILSLKDNRIRHYEVLARMRDKDGAIVMPGNFIGVAERYNLISDIDMTICAKAIRVQAQNQAQGRELSFSVNLSGKDLENHTFMSGLQEMVRSSDANAENIIFEITETEAVNDLEKAKAFIHSLKSMGCKFSLDDFGVGFTSFLYLKEMQVDYLKIDGCFIKKLHENSNDQVFVKAIVDVASGLGIKTVAEFVEEEETLKLLRDLGVDYAQGYLIGKPGPDLSS